MIDHKIVQSIPVIFIHDENVYMTKLFMYTFFVFVEQPALLYILVYHYARSEN